MPRRYRTPASSSLAAVPRDTAVAPEDITYELLRVLEEPRPTLTSVLRPQGSSILLAWQVGCVLQALLNLQGREWTQAMDACSVSCAFYVLCVTGDKDLVSYVLAHCHKGGGGGFRI